MFGGDRLGIHPPSRGWRSAWSSTTSFFPAADELREVAAALPKRSRTRRCTPLHAERLEVEELATCAR